MGWTAPDDATLPAARRRAAQRRLFGAALSLAVHLGVLVFLVAALRSPPAPAETAPIVVELVDERPPAPSAQPKPKRPVRYWERPRDLPGRSMARPSSMQSGVRPLWR